MINGIIVKAISGFFYVDDGSTVYECRSRGIMKKDGVTPCVGDNAVVSLSADSGVVEKIVDRKNLLARPPIANVGRLYIISSFENPAPNTLIIDKLICSCEAKKIEPVIVINKSDMGDYSEYEKINKGAGFETYTVSCVTGEGIDELYASFGSGISVLTGNSGVGKSSLLNKMFPGLSLKTGEISEKLGRGRHTTRHSELFKNGRGGFIADTPGFATVDSEPMLKENLALCYREFEPYLGRCKFTTCSHTCEKGCAVLEAVHSGKISAKRHENYCAIYRELSALKSWELK